MRLDGGLAVLDGWAGVCHPGRQPVAPPGATNHGPLDLFSVVHGLCGMAFGVLGLSLAQTLIIAVGWELAEHVLKNACPAAFVHPTQDTLANAASDVLSAVLGWWTGRGLRRSAPQDLANRHGR
jgi:hypothetical protein